MFYWIGPQGLGVRHVRLRGLAEEDPHGARPQRPLEEQILQVRKVRVCNLVEEVAGQTREGDSPKDQGLQVRGVRLFQCREKECR